MQCVEILQKYNNSEMCINTLLIFHQLGIITKQ